jgi:hypothetical protein
MLALYIVGEMRFVQRKIYDDAECLAGIIKKLSSSEARQGVWGDLYPNILGKNPLLAKIL